MRGLEYDMLNNIFQQLEQRAEKEKADAEHKQETGPLHGDGGAR
jgi:hypothetical protein